ncbi:MAG: hypothetical protein AB8H79_20290 [Myxococcota bacterium]
MKQAADERPDPTVYRKAAIVHGAAKDYSGKAQIKPIPNFDLDRTIFQTLKGKASRYVVRKRVGKEAHWEPEAAATVQQAYDAHRSTFELPSIDPALLAFMVEECDFDVEHADGSFLDHLYFCFEYSALHYPQHSPLVMLLHSILGTGTNTFAMTADKMPALQALMTPFEWNQTQAFPSVLRLLYAGDLREQLQQNTHRASELASVKMHRVIDNAPIELSGEDFWIALNYQLIHLVDFLPVANWVVHQNDTSFILFRELYDLLGKAGQRQAKVDYDGMSGPRTLTKEQQSYGAWLTTLIPVSVSDRMARRSVSKFSEQAGHSLHYELTWK